MSNGKKILIGLFTIAPLVLMLLVMYFFFANIAEIERMDRQVGGPPPDEFFQMLGGFFFGIVLIFLLSVGEIIFYSIHAYRNPAVAENMRIVWVLIFIFAGIIGNLIYFFMYILNDPPAVPAQTRTDPFGT